MKKMIIILLLIALFAPSFAQDAPIVAVEKNVLKVNTLALIIGSGSIFYERKFTDLTSGQMGLGYLNYKIEDTKFSGLILTPEVKFYVRNNAIDGFYISPYLRYNNYKYEVKESDSKGTFNSYGGGVAFGRQWIFKKGFVMDLFFGGHYLSASVNVTSGTEPTDVTKLEGFRTRIGFNLGFAF